MLDLPTHAEDASSAYSSDAGGDFSDHEDEFCSAHGKKKLHFNWDNLKEDVQLKVLIQRIDRGIDRRMRLI